MVYWHDVDNGPILYPKTNLMVPEEDSIDKIIYLIKID